MDRSIVRNSRGTSASAQISVGRRRWCLRDGIGADRPGVLLSDEPLASAVCVILLAPPGLGKTTELLELDRQQQRDRPGTSFLIDLREVSDLASLRRRFADVRSAAPRQGAWTLWLDAVDEFAEREPSAVPALGEEICDAPADGMNVRVACRAAEWPALLEERLRRKWSDELTVTAELLPLTDAEVTGYAEASGADPVAFHRWIRSVRAEPFAERPILLPALLESFLRNEALTGIWPLYEKLLRTLAGDPCAGARDPHRDDMLPEDRLDVAGRIAALGLLSGTFRVESGVALAVLSDEVPLCSVAAAPRTCRARSVRSVPFDDEVRRTLGTAIFASTAAGTWFAHKTYAEFLAARYLLELRLPDEHLLSILGLSESGAPVPTGRRELLLWLALKSAPVSRALARDHPGLLIGSDVVLLGDEQRSVAARAFLEGVSTHRVAIDRLPRWSDYAPLVHPRTIDDVRPWLTDQRREMLARRCAVEIAGAAVPIASADVAQELISGLLRIATDPAERVELRTAAAHEVLHRGGDADRSALRPLLDLPPDADPSDELRGVALQALFPREIGWAELVRHLRPEQDSALIGTYAHFLFSCGSTPISRTDLDALLPWAFGQVQAEKADSLSHLRRIYGAIVAAALREVGDAVVAEQAATLLLRLRDADVWRGVRREEHPDIWSIEEDRSRRLALLRGALAVLSRGDAEPWELFHSTPRILAPADLDLLLDAVPPGAPDVTRRQFDDLASLALGHAPIQAIESLWARAEADPGLRACRSWFAGTPIDGPDARAARRSRQLDLAESRRAATRAADLLRRKAAYKREVDSELEQARTGDIEAWHRFVGMLEWPPEEPGARALTTRIEDLRGWELAGPLPEGSITEAATAFLVGYEPSAAEAFIAGQSRRAGDWSWIFALRWVLRRTAASSLPSSVWERGVGVLWGHWIQSELSAPDLLAALDATVNVAPERVAHAIGLRLLAGDASDIVPALLRHRGRAVVVEAARGAYLRRTGNTGRAAAAFLLAAGDEEAWRDVEAALLSRSGGPEARSAAVSLASSAFDADPRRAWSMLRGLRTPGAPEDGDEFERESGFVAGR